MYILFCLKLKRYLLTFDSSLFCNGKDDHTTTITTLAPPAKLQSRNCEAGAWEKVFGFCGGEGSQRWMAPLGLLLTKQW